MNKERTILYLFSINAIIYIASGFYTPFLSAYYAQKGIDAEKIGILLMIGPCVVLLTQRFWAKISDRTGKRKEVLLVTIVGSGFSMLLYYLGNSFLCMFFATVVVTSFTTAVIPLSDAILIARSLKEGYSYSIIRLGGTLGYAVMTICAGMYLKTRPQMQFVFAFFAYMILFCFCIGLKEERNGQIALAVWVVTVTDHLGRCFICLGDGKTQEFLFHPLYKRCEIAVSTLDDPVRHGLSGNVYAIPLEFLLYTVECRRIHILHIQNGSKQGRGHNAVAQQVFRAVPSHKFILMVAICPDIHLNGMDFHCPGFRLVPQSFIDFIRHPAPAAFPIEGIQLLHGHGMDRYSFFRKCLQVEFPLAFGFFLACHNDRFFNRWFLCRGIKQGLCLVEKR